MRRGRMLGLLFGVAVLLAGALVVAQPGGGGGGPGGRGGGPGGRMGGFPFGGTVVSADIANGVIEVDAGGRQMQVYPVQATRLLKKEKADAKDLQVGDSVNANGAPVKIAVRSLTADKSTPPPAPPADQPAAPGRQAMMMMMGRGGGTVAMASGKVTSTAPLKLQTTTPAPDGSQAQREVELEVPADADVSRIVDGAWEEVVKGATFTALIHQDDQQRMVLDSMTLGDTMPAGFGGGPGGPGGRGGRGGRGGGGAGGAGGGGGAGAPGGGPF